MKKIRVAINGFGRIGRAAFKIALERPEMEVVAINDLADAKVLGHLLQHDTAYGRYRYAVGVEEGGIRVNDTLYPVLCEKDPTKLPWKDLAVDVVLECTGRFVDKDSSAQHITAGARKVVLSAPAKGGAEDVKTFLMGVNEDTYADEAVVSNASCTTNCLAPVAKVLEDAFGIEKALMTTIHSYTADQNLQDAPHKDLRRARAAGQNIVPTTTGAAIAVAEVIPVLKDRFDGLALRVPTIVVSITDFTFLLKKKTTVEEVNAVLRTAAEGERMRGVLAVTEEPLVSSDFIGNPFSSIVDLPLTKVVDGDFVKVVAWYDNEWGYSQRLVEMAALVGQEK